MTLAPEDHEAQARHQQQKEDDAAEGGFVEMAEGFEAGPGAEGEGGQTDQEKPSRVGAD